jgi:hypothetical protein
MAPISGAATATAVVGAPIVVGGASADSVVTANVGAKIIQFPRILRPLAAGTAAAATSYKLAAEPINDQPTSLLPLPEVYVYWPD